MREHGITIRSFVRAASLLSVCWFVLPFAMWAQATTTYHLHAALSSTPGVFQLQAAGPGATSVSFMSGPMTVAGDYQVAGFDTQAGVPGNLGYFPTGSHFTFTVWMQTTIASHGPVYPEVRMYVNNPAQGALFCAATSTSVLTTTLQPFSLSCTTTTNVGMQATDRLYLWIGAAQAAIGGPTLRAKLSVEGSYDGQVAVPSNPLVPQISIAPNIGGAGTAVTITGTNLGDGNQSVVTFNGMQAPATWSGGSIITTVPSGAFSGNVLLTVAGVPSNPVPFTDTSPSIQPPLSPSTGSTGIQVTINGKNFGNNPGTVTFGTTNADIGSWSDQKIVVIVPSSLGIGTVQVFVTTSGQQSSNSVPFTVIPVITSLLFVEGPKQMGVIILGRGLGTQQGNSTVTLNGSPLTVLQWSAPPWYPCSDPYTCVTVQLPDSATSGNVVVNVATPSGTVTTNGAPFKVDPPFCNSQTGCPF